MGLSSKIVLLSIALFIVSLWCSCGFKKGYVTATRAVITANSDSLKVVSSDEFVSVILTSATVRKFEDFYIGPGAQGTKKPGKKYDIYFTKINFWNEETQSYINLNVSQIAKIKVLETIKLNEHNVEVILKNGNILPVKAIND